MSATWYQFTCTEACHLDIDRSLGQLAPMHPQKIFIAFSVFICYCLLISVANAANSEEQEPQPQCFPALPPWPEDQLSWPVDVYQAHCRIEAAYNQASDLLRLEEYDPLWLCLHSERLFHRFAPLIEQMEIQVGRNWALRSYEHLLQLVAELETAARSSEAV